MQIYSKLERHRKILYPAINYTDLIMYFVTNLFQIVPERISRKC